MKHPLKINLLLVSLFLEFVLLDLNALPVKCGTPRVLSGKKGITARPVMDNFVDSRHFRIWYSLARPNRPDTTDLNPQNGIPDYIDKVKDIFEYCYSMIINTFGYSPPLPDSSCETGRRNTGGDDRIDIYVMELYGNYFGETIPDEPLRLDPLKAPGYIIIDNDYIGYGYDDKPIEALCVTAAHELFHLVQFAYDYQEDLWWMEATAVFMEEQLYPQVNDYLNYLDDFFATPELSLTAESGPENRIYGTALFPIFLARRFGWAIVKEIWGYCAEYNVASINAIQRALSERNKNLTEEFGVFSVWNLFTGQWADTSKFYPDGHLYPSIAISETLRLSQGELHKTKGLPFELSAAYILLPSKYIPKRGKNISFSFAPQNGDWYFAAVGLSPINTDQKDTICTGTEGNFRYASLLDRIIFVAALSRAAGSFSLDVVSYGELVSEDTIFSPYPNPVRGLSDTIWFPLYLDDDSEVSVALFTTSGELIAENSLHMTKGQHKEKPNTIFLPINRKDLKNDIYIYIVKTAHKKLKGKVAVVR